MINVVKNRSLIKTICLVLLLLSIFALVSYFAVTLDRLVDEAITNCLRGDDLMRVYGIPDPRDKLFAKCLDNYSACEEEIPYDTCDGRFRMCIGDAIHSYSLLKK